MMNNKQIQKIFADEAFVRELMALEDNAAFQAALKEKGVEVTDEDVATIRNLQAKVDGMTEEQRKQLADGELPEELLEEVSGGFVAAAIICGAFLTALGFGIADSVSGDDTTTVTKYEDGSVAISGSW